MEFIKGCLVTCWKILIRPTRETWVNEAKKGERQFIPVTGWLVLLGIYFGLVVGIAVKDGWALVSTALSMSLILPLTVILTTSVMHLLYQRLFRRQQYIYDGLLYITTAIIFTIQIISLPLSLVLPVDAGDYFSSATLLYQLILIFLALKHLTNLKHQQAAVLMLISLVAGVGVFLCIGPFLLSMMGGVNSVL